MRTNLTLLEKYYFKVLFKFFLISLLVLTTIFLFFQMLEELPKIGLEKYTLKASLVYLFFLTPSVIYNIGNLAILIGLIIGFASLINSREIHVILVSGISARDLIFKGIKFGFILSILILIFGELISISSSFYAKQYRSYAMNNGEILRESRNFWVKKDNHFIYIGNNINGNSFKDIKVISIEDNSINRLINSEAGLIIDEKLLLEKAYIEDIENHANVSNIRKFYKEKYKSDIEFEGEKINLIELDLEMMRIDELVSQILILKSYNLDYKEYLLEIGNRITRPLTLAALLLIAMPLTFNLKRDTSLGSKIFLGIALGIISHFITKIVLILVMKMEYSFFFAFFTPLILIYILGFYLFKKHITLK